MPSTAKTRTLATLLTFAAATAAMTAHGLRAQGVPVGFEESYALAKDRKSVVANLIPGTDDWYYYHCRERLVPVEVHEAVFREGASVLGLLLLRLLL
ncbi:MAG TPA: hypothetical protein EYP98_19820, partial [Planctomycetes bacterium]|nr:hypothetical protein [Planctomycetota bacterium]